MGDDLPSTLIPSPVETTCDLLRSLPGKTYKLEFREYVYPECIYFLCKGETLLYIGRSTSLRSRIEHHYRSGEIPFDTVFVYPISEDVPIVERALIGVCEPPYNSTAKTGGKEWSEAMLAATLGIGRLADEWRSIAECMQQCD